MRGPASAADLTVIRPLHSSFYTSLLDIILGPQSLLILVPTWFSKSSSSSSADPLRVERVGSHPVLPFLPSSPVRASGTLAIEPSGYRSSGYRFWSVFFFLGTGLPSQTGRHGAPQDATRHNRAPGILASQSNHIFFVPFFVPFFELLLNLICSCF